MLSSVSGPDGAFPGDPTALLKLQNVPAAVPL
jgi:hypothetical protein